MRLMLLQHEGKNKVGWYFFHFFSNLRMSAVDCDIPCITLSWVIKTSLATQRTLAILLKPLQLVPAEDVVHCIHLERPVLTLKPPNCLKLLN